jgi:poly(3-hydroxybutyrate) depolymerase
VLYSLYEAHHTALAPWRFWAELSRGWFDHPFSPFAHLPISRRIAATSDLFLRLTGRYEKPAWNVGEFDIASDKPFCKLLHFRNSPGKPKVLVVAPLSGHHSTLLRDTVRSLLDGHDVWVTDWVDARGSTSRP